MISARSGLHPPLLRPGGLQAAYILRFCGRAGYKRLTSSALTLILTHIYYITGKRGETKILCQSFVSRGPEVYE